MVCNAVHVDDQQIARGIVGGAAPVRAPAGERVEQGSPFRGRRIQADREGFRDPGPALQAVEKGQPEGVVPPTNGSARWVGARRERAASVRATRRERRSGEPAVPRPAGKAFRCRGRERRRSPSWPPGPPRHGARRRARPSTGPAALARRSPRRRDAPSENSSAPGRFRPPVRRRNWRGGCCRVEGHRKSRGWGCWSARTRGHAPRPPTSVPKRWHGLQPVAAHPAK